MMSYEEEVSGYDLKKWIDWSVGLYYWSPSPSQIYTELKKLERLGLVVSRIVHDGDGARSRRLYRITKAGLDHVTDWVNESPADPPVLKHSTLLRVTFGHLSSPARLKELLREHIAYIDSMQIRAAEDSRGAEELPAWAYSVAALRWAAKYYAAERQLALELIADIDEAAAVLAEAGNQDPDMIRPTPGLWRQIETKIQRRGHD
ncbi:PadR family transcriptional regulator [Mycobacteroides abscessus]|uniref:PadR family transcriptional regulator n=1 Tax=Mycobacteroides abscessus TaxID=36809 RepID=UPI0002EEA6D4|nr:PadR family transcriptional regulator [Mycobacteroides abscessus]